MELKRKLYGLCAFIAVLLLVISGTGCGRPGSNSQTENDRATAEAVKVSVVTIEPTVIRDVIVLPDKLWGNYNLIFGVRRGAQIVNYPFFDDKGAFNLKAFGACIQEASQGRDKIIVILKERPSNASQLADALKMDYKTIRHHLDVMLENKLIVKMGGKYAASYFLSPQLELQYDVFHEIWLKLQKEEKN